jgi:3-oxoacyl-[acyl-carrier-protein] synthase II
MERVVITGLGMVTPLGCGVRSTWSSLIKGLSGIVKIDRCPIDNLSVQIAGQVPEVGDNAFILDEHIPVKDQKKMDRFIMYAVTAAEEAIKDANLKVQSQEHAEDIGVMIGSGIGGLPLINDMAFVLKEKGARRVSPFFIPASLINLASGHVSIRHGFKGPNHAVVTACATGAHAIGDSMRLIQYGDVKVMVAGGTEGAISPLGIAGFSSARALASSYNGNPTKASRPWDKKREGFVMGEGAGVIVLESLSHALSRNAKIYGEIVGYGLSGDAYHITSPAEDGDGAYRAMRNALKKQSINPSDIDYVNAHGTSTPTGDVAEIRAMKRLFQDHIYKLSISSTKSSIGHLLGAAGSVEAIFSILSMRDGMIPPTLNLDDPDDECKGIDLTPHVARAKDISCVMSNSFGFGGTNASLVFKKFI